MQQIKLRYLGKKIIKLDLLDLTLRLGRPGKKDSEELAYVHFVCKSIAQKCSLLDVQLYYLKKRAFCCLNLKHI